MWHVAGESTNIFFDQIAIADEALGAVAHEFFQNWFVWPSSLFRYR
jgi:hypothetical protein